MDYNQAFEGYKIGKTLYDIKCIYCSNEKSTALMQDKDGGAFRKCDRCGKNFMSRIMSPALDNYSYATSHLKGTN